MTAALVGSAILFAGLGAAGALPGPAQTMASNMLSTVGVSVPNSDRNTGTLHPEPRGPSTSGGATAAGNGDGNGGAISRVASDGLATELNTGPAVSPLPIDGSPSENGRGVAGAAEPATTGGSTKTPVAAPDPGGTTNAGQASSGSSQPSINAAETDAGTHGREHTGAGNAPHDRP